MEDTIPKQSSADVKLDYMQRDIHEIKGDVKDIKNDYVSRREFTDSNTNLKKEFSDANTLIRQEFLDAVKDVKNDIALPKKIIYGGVTVIVLAVLGAIIELVIVRR